MKSRRAFGSFRFGFFAATCAVLFVVTLVLMIFAGIGWAVLVIYLTGLAIKLAPSRSWLGRQVVGKQTHEVDQPTPLKTSRRVAYWVFQIIVNLVWLSVVYVAFRVDIRLIDVFQ